MREPAIPSTNITHATRLKGLHKIIVPVNITPLDNVSARITSPRTLAGHPVLAIVTKISPLGAELVISDSELELQRGSDVVAEIDIDGITSKFEGLVVSLEKLPEQKIGLAIRLTSKEQPTSGGDDRREGARWSCAEMFYPTGVASNPAKFNDFIYFRVQNISKGGFRLLTSMRNKFVVPGVTLDCIISFPMVSQIAATVEVMNLGIVSENDKDYLAIGARIKELSAHQSNVMSQYLAQFGEVRSFTELTKEGLSPITLNKALKFSFVSSSAEYFEVLALRHLAYIADGKLSPDLSVADMSDIYDARSRILICKKGTTVVGTARLSFHEHTDSLEHEEFVKWPSELPRRDESVEVTRLCTHPEYQGAGLIFSLLRFCVITAVQGRRSWVLSSATSDLVPMYDAVGLKSVGITFNHPTLSNLKHHIMVGNIQDAMLGRTSGPIMWNLVWKDAFNFMVDHEFVATDVVSRVRLALYRSIAPFIPLLRRVASSRVQRRKRE